MSTDYEKHHEWRIDKYKSEGKSVVNCPSCGTEYASRGIANHWRRSDCSYPEPSPYQHDVLTGLLMGDATCVLGKNAANPKFSVRMNTEPFLAWLADLFVSLVSDVRKENITPHTPNMKDHIWCLNFRSVPALHEFHGWYESGNKRFPDDLELTPTIAKMWYVCDGGISESGTETSRDRIAFSVSNEDDRGDYLHALFEEHGFDPTLSHHTLRFGVDESEDLLEWMGDPPPGFEYKWKI